MYIYKLPLNIHMLCKFRRNVVLLQYVLCIIQRLQLKHLALVPTVARIMITIEYCIRSRISAVECSSSSIYCYNRRHTQRKTRTSVSGWNVLPSYALHPDMHAGVCYNIQ